MAPIHPTLAAGRWASLTLSQQLANIGSEVSRLVRARERGDTVAAERALERALELLDLTQARWRRAPRALELSRLRELICGIFLREREYEVSSNTLEAYFLPFALRGRH